MTAGWSSSNETQTFPCIAEASIDLMVYFAPFPLLVDGDDTRVGVVGRNRNLGTLRHKLLLEL